MLPCVCSVIDHRRRQNVVRTTVTHLAIASCATFLFLPHFDVICDLLLNRRTATGIYLLNRDSSIAVHFVFSMFVSNKSVCKRFCCLKHARTRDIWNRDAAPLTSWTVLWIAGDMWKRESWESFDERIRSPPYAGKQELVGTSEIPKCPCHKSADITGNLDLESTKWLTKVRALINSRQNSVSLQYVE